MKITRPKELTPRKLQADVRGVFELNFGYTPFKERMDDITNEFFELKRWNDINNIKEEAGDLMSSLVQLCNECGWEYDELIYNSLNKIERRSSQYKSLGRKTKVAILGGAFNPITKGHIEVAKYVLDTSRVFDEVWLMPANNHMFGKEMMPVNHRLAMCQLAAQCDGRIKVFEYEIENNLSGETFNLFKRLLVDPLYADNYNFSMIIGMDNAVSFERWVNYELLERMVRFVVVPRRGYRNATNGTEWFLKPPHIFLHKEKDKLPMEMSSTLIRLSLQNKNEEIIEKGLDPLVYNYIKEHNLYKDAIFSS